MVLIREMRSEDAEEVSVVICEAMRDAWERYERDYYPKRALEFDMAYNSPEKMLERLANPQNFAFVAEENGEVLGTVLGEIVGESGLARIGWVGVHPRRQRRGIGKALVQRAIEHCREKGCHKITLYTTPPLIPAINLYLTCGFVPEAYFHKEWWGVGFIKMSLWLEPK